MKQLVPPRFAFWNVICATLWPVLGALGACSSESSAQTIDNREVSVACGRCVFEMPEATTGCPWAVEIDGRHYLVQGEVPQGHQNHAPDGICNTRRRAVVDGRIRGDRFISTRFELKRATQVPDNPRFSPDDVH